MTVIKTEDLICDRCGTKLHVWFKFYTCEHCGATICKKFCNGTPDNHKSECAKWSDSPNLSRYF